MLRKRKLETSKDNERMEVYWNMIKNQGHRDRARQRRNV